MLDTLANTGLGSCIMLALVVGYICVIAFTPNNITDQDQEHDQEI